MKAFLAPVLLILLAFATHARAFQTAQYSARIEGRVVDQTGAPIEAAEVLSHDLYGNEFLSVTGVDGHFEVTVIWEPKSGNHNLCVAQVRKRGFGMVSSSKVFAPGDSFDIGILGMEPGGSVKGRIVDHNNRGLARVSVFLHHPKFPARGAYQLHDRTPPHVTDRCETNAQGDFEFTDVAPGTWFISARSKATHIHSSENFYVWAEEAIQIPTLLLTPFPPEQLIEGQVVGANGHPVENASVSVALSPVDGRLPNRQSKDSAETNADGRFTLYLPLPALNPMGLIVTPPNLTLEAKHIRGVNPGQRDILVRLHTSPTIQVSVTDQDGKPVEFFGWSLGFFTGSEPTAFHEAGLATVHVPKEARTLSITSDRYETSPELALAPGHLPEVIPVQLAQLPGYSGTVTFEGMPIGGAQVQLVTRDDNELGNLVPSHNTGLYWNHGQKKAFTDDHGRYFIQSRPPRQHTFIRAMKAGFADSIAGPFVSNASEVELQLGTPGTLEAKLHLPAGIPQRPIELIIFQTEPRAEPPNSLSGVFRRTSTSPTGALHLTGLTPGTWLAKIQVDDSVFANLGWSQQRIADEHLPFVFKIKAGETTKCDFTIGAGKMPILVGQLDAGHGVRITSFGLYLTSGDSLLIAANRSYAGNTFRLACREPGLYRLIALIQLGHHEYRYITDLIELKPGRNAWVRQLTKEQWNEAGYRFDTPK